MSIFRTQVSTGLVCAATGVSNGALQTWIRRGLLVGHKEAPISGGGSPGHHRRFSFYNVMEVAVAKALTDLGADVGLAFSAAREFAHIGDAAFEDEPRRDPSIVYDCRTAEVRTYIAVSQERFAVGFWRKGEDPIQKIQERLLYARHFNFVDANEIFDRVTAALGHVSIDVLAEAYDISD